MALTRDVVGYEGLYLVTDEGEVMSCDHEVFNGRGYYVRKGRRLKQGCRDGYPCVALCKDGVMKTYSVHRLVAEAFIENPDELPQVNHIDENRANNKADNLEWCTQQYNVEYSKGKWVAQYSAEGEKMAEYKSIAVASKLTGIKRTSINNVLTGWSRTAGGYYWEYVE